MSCRRSEEEREKKRGGGERRGKLSGGVKTVGCLSVFQPQDWPALIWLCCNGWLFHGTGTALGWRGTWPSANRGSRLLAKANISSDDWCSAVICLYPETILYWTRHINSPVKALNKTEAPDEALLDIPMWLLQIITGKDFCFNLFCILYSVKELSNSVPDGIYQLVNETKIKILWTFQYLFCQ